jgi:hypothetical protein
MGEAGENEMIDEERRIRKVNATRMLFHMMFKILSLGSPKPT